MPHKKKKFINKKNSVTFHLVHRSQKDPLVADETAPQHVLVAVGEKQSKSKDTEKKKEEQRKYGVFFDDNYDYLQHLRTVDETPNVDWEPVEKFHIAREDLRATLPGPLSEAGPSTKPAPTSNLQLPSSVFASHVEEEIGLLNRAAPQSGLRLDLDPDIVAAMDEDFDFDDPDNCLEDNFMELADASGGEKGDEDRENGGEEDGSWTDESGDDVDSDDLAEEDDEVMSLNGPQLSFSGEETKSRFTEYSMSSSVIRRNNQLTLLDSRFEQMFASYDDTEIGALDCDEIEGPVEPNSKLVLQCADEFEKDKKKAALETGKHAGVSVLLLSESESDDEMVGLRVEPRTKEKWDCESILSTRSTLYNHPKLIPSGPSKPKPIRISEKTGIPLGVLSERRGLTAKALASLDAANKAFEEDDSASVALSILSTLSIRPKGETAEERLARKKALKEYRKDRRAERKANTVAFKEEKKKQEKLVLHNRNCANTVKIV